MTYLSRLYRHSLPLGIMVTAFIVISLAVTVRRYDITPFFVWNFFAKPLPVVWQQPILLLVADGDTLDYTSAQTPVLTRLFVTDNLQNIAEPLHKNGVHPHLALINNSPFAAYYAPVLPLITNDTTALQPFHAYLKSYIAQHIAHRAVQHLTVIAQSTQFYTDGSCRPLTHTVVFTE
jgi:hypothetical protein